jgi:transmembrane sensor
MAESVLAYLFDRYFRGVATPEEKEALMELMAEEGHEEEVRRLMEEAWSDFQPGGPVFDDEKSRLILQDALAGEQGDKPVAGVHIFPITRVAAAAVILLAVSGILYFRVRQTGSRKNIAVVSKDMPRVARDIPPGMDGAVLTLADGRPHVGGWEKDRPGQRAERRAVRTG